MKKPESPLEKDNDSFPKSLVWNIYKRFPHSFDRAFRELSRSVLPFFRLKISLRKFVEASERGDRSLILVGPLRGSHFLLREFFEGESSCEFREEVTLWRLADVIDELRETVDLVIVRLPSVIAKAIRLRGFLNTPFQVGCSRAPMIPEESLPSKNTLRADLKRAGKQGFKTRWTQRMVDFEHFYYGMHLPFVLSRFGEDATLYGIHRLRRAFRFGSLILLSKQGELAAGALLQGDGDRYRALVFGVSPGNMDVFRNGGSAALYSAFLKRAFHEGYPAADFGLVRTHLRNGILRHKRKWGVEFQRRRYSEGRLLYYWPALNRSVANFLERTCPILEEGKDLSAFVLTSGKVLDTRRFLRGLWIPGLKRIYFSNRTESAASTPVEGMGKPDTRFKSIPWHDLAGRPTSTLLEQLSRK